jgi:hypothetical protein
VDSGLTEVDLSQFTGKDIEHYDNNYVMEALAQAGDLFEIATRIPTLPDRNTLDGRLAVRGILSMAEALFEGNNYRDLRTSPFKSETIGSYTYTLVEGSVLQGIPTGISWFDLAVERLAWNSSDASQSISSTSIAAFDRPGDVRKIGQDYILIGPADTEHFTQGPKRYLGVSEQPD